MLHNAPWGVLRHTTRPGGPHRLLALGVGRTEHRRYGTPAEHIAAHGLDALGIRASLDGFLNPSGRVPEHEPWSGLRHTTRTV